MEKRFQCAKMKGLLVWLLIVAVCFADVPPDLPGPPLTDGGGVGCIGCTLVTAIIEQVAQVQNKTVDDSLLILCSYLPSAIQSTCEHVIIEYGPTIIALIDANETPDVVCHQLSFCTNASCTLFPKPHAKFDHPRSNGKLMEWIKRENLTSKYRMGKTPWDWIWDDIQKAVNSHNPLVDLDGDRFSSIETLRGYAFRGRDCNDLSSVIYPGRNATTLSDHVDHNCNGIYGVNPETGKSYESELCDGTKYMGVAILGDSAAAHFHIPPSYMTGAEINSNTYANLVDLLADEFDWPMMSATTGYRNMSWVGHPKGPVHSIYMEAVKRNKCVHRDYQNIAVNGARTGAMADNIIKSFARNQKTDKPMFVTYALVGNDVCHHQYGTSAMTTPAQFKANVLKSLRYLDTVLPKGSHVATVGLAQGQILYEAMHGLVHPIGKLHNDVTYDRLYDYLNGLGSSPCFGWMNTHAYWRNETAKHVATLNAVYPEIIRENTFENFDVTYFNFSIESVIGPWVKAGRKVSELIEPVDGFHPSQNANYLMADFQIQEYLKHYPDFLPGINPHNAKIEELFGDQGGYGPE